MFQNIEIGKHKCYHHKKLILFEYYDMEKMQVSSIISFSEKIINTLFGYKNNGYKIKLSCIMLPKPSAYVKSYDDETK